MYTLNVLKQIHSSFADASLNDIWVFKNFELPIIPLEGMTLKWCNLSGSMEYTQLITVIYNVDTDIFEGSTTEDKEIYTACMLNQPHRTVEEITQEYISKGWTVKQ